MCCIDVWVCVTQSDRLDMWCRYAEAHTPALTLSCLAEVRSVLSLVCDRTSFPLSGENQNSPELIGSCLRGIVGDLKNAESLINLRTLLFCCLSWVFVFILFLFQHHYIVVADRDRWWDPYTFHLKKHLLPYSGKYIWSCCQKNIYPFLFSFILVVWIKKISVVGRIKKPQVTGRRFIHLIFVSITALCLSGIF